MTDTFNTIENQRVQDYLSKWAEQNLTPGEDVKDWRTVEAMIELIQETYRPPERPTAGAATTVAYAVHVEGSLWDDPEISAWCESIRDAATMMEKAEAFFADDPERFPILLTIVRAEFTADEWRQVVGNGWAFGIDPESPEGRRARGLEPIRPARSRQASIECAKQQARAGLPVGDVDEPRF